MGCLHPSFKEHSCEAKSRRKETSLCVAYKKVSGGFPGGAVVENPPANAGDTGSSLGLGGSHMPRSK